MGTELASCLLEWCQWTGAPARRDEHVLNHSIGQISYEMGWLNREIDSSTTPASKIEEYQDRLTTLRSLLGGLFD